MPTTYQTHRCKPLCTKRAARQAYREGKVDPPQALPRHDAGQHDYAAARMGLGLSALCPAQPQAPARCST